MYSYISETFKILNSICIFNIVNIRVFQIGVDIFALLNFHILFPSMNVPQFYLTISL